MRKLIYLSLLLCALPSWATWTLTQVKSNNVCGGTNTCAVPTSATGTAHALIAGIIQSTGSGTASITSVTAGACSVPWVHCANCSITSTGGGLDFSYCTASVSGQTSITITNSTTLGTNSTGVIWEGTSSLGTIAIDSGATPSGTKADTTCTACAGVALTLSGSNDFVAVLASGTGTISNLTGTGFVNDLANPNGDGVGHGLIASSATAPTTWTMTSGTMSASAIAIKETGAGVSVFGIDKKQKLEKFWPQ